MVVAMCAKCKKFISISNIPTGNPTAWENPETFALYYGICNCEGSTFFCSDCLEQTGLQCPNCGRSLQIHGPSAIPYEIYRERKDDIRRIILAKFGKKQKDKKSDETFIHRDTPAKGYTRSEVSTFSPSFVVSFLSFCILLLFTIAVYFFQKAAERFLSFGKLGIIFLTIVIMSSVGASSFIMK